jgi:hypothetical protein
MIEFVKPIKDKIVALNGENEARLYEYTQLVINWKCSYNNKQIINLLQKALGFERLSNKNYAIFMETLTNIEHQNNDVIMSIDKVKGLGSNECWFVLDNAMYTRLQNSSWVNDKINNLLYVALTRSKRNLVFVISKELEAKYPISEFQKWFSDNNITEYFQ